MLFKIKSKKNIFLIILIAILIATFYFSYKYINKKRIKIFNLEKKILDLNIEKENIAEKIGFIPFDYSSDQKINILDNTYNLEKYTTNVMNFTKGLGGKGSSYLDYYNNQLYLVSANGIIANINLKNIKLQKFNMKIIKSNLNKILNKRLMYDQLAYGIKDILISEKKIYITFTDEIKQNCFNISILEGNISKKFIEFTYFFKPDSCIKKDIEEMFSLHQSGGRLVEFDNKHLLLSVGEFRSRNLAQDINSINGKIIRLEKKTKKIEIISMGHRNPQGLFLDKKNNLIYSTEHGPKGGDEINVIEESSNVSNFGWPLSSYGEHYGHPKKDNKKIYKIAPLHNSHEDYGFIEPKINFNPSIGISQIALLNIYNKKILIVGALGYDISEGDKSLHFFLIENNVLSNHKIISIDERIRDLIYVAKKNMIILFLESTASIGVIRL